MPGVKPHVESAIHRARSAAELPVDIYLPPPDNDLTPLGARASHRQCAYP